jgi:hypothetical protein
MKTVEVWGLAKGIRTTKEAAQGAFTVREYMDGKEHREDWLDIITIRKVKQD